MSENEVSAIADKPTVVHRLMNGKQAIMWNVSPMDNGMLLVTISYEDGSEQLQTVITRAFAVTLSAMFTNAAREHKKAKRAK